MTKFIEYDGVAFGPLIPHDGGHMPQVLKDVYEALAARPSLDPDFRLYFVCNDGWGNQYLRKEFIRSMAEPKSTLYEWMGGASFPPPEFDAIKGFAFREDSPWYSMCFSAEPDLEPKPELLTEQLHNNPLFGSF